MLSAAIEGMFLNTELFGHQRGASNKGYKKIEYGTLVLSTQNLHLGNANVNLRFEHGMVSPAYKTYRIKNCSVTLLAEWIKSEKAKQFFYDATTVGASVCRRNVEWETLYDQTLYLPTHNEQQHIAEFLSLVSERIRRQEKFIECLKKYKRGVMNSYFNGKLVLKHSIGQHYSHWQEFTLSDVSDEFKSGKSITSNEINEVGEYAVYGGNGVRGYTDHYSHEGQYIVVGRQGALCGNVRIIDGKNYLSEHAIAVKANSNHYTPFLLYLLTDMRLGQYSDQGAQPGLAVNKLLKLKRRFPEYDEQVRFATFMQQIDHKLSSEENKLEYITTLKRGLLQQLFI